MENILVTGVPRSGTTFTGRIIGFSREMNYIWEPFNQRYRKIIPHYYPYVGKGTPEHKVKLYKDIVDCTLKLQKLAPAVNIKESDTFFKSIGKRLGINRALILFSKAKINHILNPGRRLLIKDPLAIFLSRFLSESYGMAIVVVIRHPAAVFCSRNNLQWDVDFNFWRNQKDFMRDFLYLFDKEIPKHRNRLIDSSFHWLICYSFLQRLKDDYPSKVIFIRHEDLCLNPVKHFETLYNRLHIQLTDSVKVKLKRYTNGKRIEASSKNLSALDKRDSKNIIFKWKKNVSNDQLDTIMQIARPICEIYYKEDNFWSIDHS